MKGEGYWIIRTYESGDIGEKTKYWVSGRRADRNKKAERSELKKQEQNEYSAVKRLARTINANFRSGDLLVGLDYSADGMDRLVGGTCAGTEEDRMKRLWAAAEKQLKLCLRRVKREAQKSGLDCKVVAITSDMDGDTGEAVRVHHHLVVPAALGILFVEKWREWGGVSWTPLRERFEGQDYIGVADYLLRQVRRVTETKKYSTSRNLIRPEPRDRVAISEAEIGVPRGGKLLMRAAYKPGMPQYIRYILPSRYSGKGIDPGGGDGAKR